MWTFLFFPSSFHVSRLFFCRFSSSEYFGEHKKIAFNQTLYHFISFLPFDMNVFFFLLLLLRIIIFILFYCATFPNTIQPKILNIEIFFALVHFFTMKYFKMTSIWTRFFLVDSFKLCAFNKISVFFDIFHFILFVKLLNMYAPHQTTTWQAFSTKNVQIKLMMNFGAQLFLNIICTNIFWFHIKIMATKINIEGSENSGRQRERKRLKLEYLSASRVTCYGAEHQVCGLLPLVYLMTV